MAFTDKNLVITPSVGSSGEDPKIVFSGADSSLGPQSLTARIYPSSNGTLSFEGSSGQLFSITNSLTGTIYSVNDASGLPSIEVFEDGVIRLARYSGRVVIGDAVDNGVDSIQFAGNTSFQFASLNANGTFTSTGQMVSLLADGTAPLVVQSTTLVANLNADFLDGQHGSYYTNASNLSSGTVPGDRGVSAGSTSSSFVEYNGTTATAGQFDGGTSTPSGTTRLNYGGYFYPTALSLVGTGDTSTAATHYFVETGTDGFVRPKTLANAQAEIVTAASANAIAVVAGSTTQSFVRYGGTTKVAGQWDGGTTAPTNTTRLNYDGYLYATRFYGDGSQLGSLNASNLSSGTVPGDRGVSAGSTSSSFVEYNGTTATAGQFDGGTSTPSGTTRLNYGGYLYATRFYGDGNNLTAIKSGDQTFTVYNYTASTSGNSQIAFSNKDGASADRIVAKILGETTDNGGNGKLTFYTAFSVTLYKGFELDAGSNIALYNTSSVQKFKWDASNESVNVDKIISYAGAAATAQLFGNVTTGTVTIAGGLTTGTLNLGASAVGAKTVNIGTSTGTTVVYGSTVRLPNAGTPGAGKLLQSDASGNATWQTITSGATLSDNTTTNSDGYYPGMATTTSGAWTSATVSSTKLYFNPSTGQLNATNFNSLSDATKKENVKTIEGATEKTLALRGVTFDWIDTKKSSLGVIAQEVEQVVPDVVSTSSSGEKSVNYGSLVGLLIETIKEQNARIEKLEALLSAR